MFCQHSTAKGSHLTYHLGHRNPLDVLFPQFVSENHMIFPQWSHLVSINIPNIHLTFPQQPLASTSLSLKSPLHHPDFSSEVPCITLTFTQQYLAATCLSINNSSIYLIFPQQSLVFIHLTFPQWPKHLSIPQYSLAFT